MSDLISRSALIEDIKRRKYINKPLTEIFETIIDEQPPVEAAPAVRGEWKPVERVLERLEKKNRSLHNANWNAAIEEAIEIIKEEFGCES